MQLIAIDKTDPTDGDLNTTFFVPVIYGTIIHDDGAEMLPLVRYFIISGNLVDYLLHSSDLLCVFVIMQPSSTWDISSRAFN